MDSDLQLPSEIRDPFAADEERQEQRPSEPEYPGGGGPADEERQEQRPSEPEYPGGGGPADEERQEQRPSEPEYPSSTGGDDGGGDGGFVMPSEVRDPFTE